MKKKAIWLLAGGLMVGALVLLAVSCGGGGTTTPTTPTQPITPAQPTAPAEPAKPPAATPTSTIPKIPHTLEGRTDCVMCHQTGIVSAPKFPASLDHTSFTGATCSGCHTGAVGPKIPDSHAGRSTDTCVSCHKDGITNAPKFPVDHSGRTSETCRGCHQPG